MAQFQGQLSQNQVKTWLYNQIISIMTFVDNVGTDFDSLVSKFRVDGSKYGDRKQYVSLELPVVNDFVMDSQTDTNALATHRTKGYLEDIKLDKFKKIALTADSYITPLAFGTEGAFAQFNAALIGTIREAKKVHDAMTFNVRLGTAVATSTAQNVTVTFAGTETAQEKTLMIAKALADVETKLKFPSKNFTDLTGGEYVRSYNLSDFVVVGNSEVVNELVYEGMPVTYHKDGLFKTLGEDVLLPDMFGTCIDTSAKLAAISASTPAAGKPINSSTGAYTPGVANANGKVCSMVEKSVTVGGTTTYIRPGDEIPSGATVAATGTPNFGLGEVYMVDTKVLFKIVHKDALPFMSALELSTEFVNPANANSINHYLFWAYNSNDRIIGVPLITIKKN